MATYKKYAKDAFIALIAPIVMQVHKEGGRLLPSVRIAQAWLETGGSVPSWNNLGGYKVGSGKPTAFWDGSSVNTATKEVYGGKTVNTTANWRAYPSIYNYFKDQDLLFTKDRYAAVRAATTPLTQCQALKSCGYATDPDYASKLMAIVTANGLTKYDGLGAAGEEEELKLSEYQWGIVEAKIKALIDTGTVKDVSWLEKAKKRTLTISDLAWLTFVVA
ncbi:glycoside hydrolase family 73 protein [Cohnella sp. AR92]|uniref:glycoside hydrolase family 73 protein n=1 Tax=Cohnella sp. AR92 TaxID=648716 RepID=UPI000F8DA759|nr:glucosaminidase domain-containing protein [Cohnella sp. AR92]RUS47575.1 muramidase (flagellum-specific) [Cohnella sp. AR92]